MYLVDIGHGTEFTLIFEDEVEYTGIFDGRIDHMCFYIHCQDIFSKLEKFIDAKATMKFFAKDSFYTFTGQIIGKSERKNPTLETLDVRIMSPFKPVDLGRTDFRINITFKIKIHSFVDDQKSLFLGDFICDSISNNVSKSGICIWADNDLNKNKGEMFTLVFSVFPEWTYFAPAKLVRCQQNQATRSYSFEYGFAFDFSATPERQEKLLMDILEAKIRH